MIVFGQSTTYTIVETRPKSNQLNPIITRYLIVDFLNLIYPISSIALTAFYLPQIFLVLKAKSELKDISLLSWGTWAVCITIGGFYGALIVQDLKVALANFGAGTCCFIVFFTVLYKRSKYKASKEIDSDFSNNKSIILKDEIDLAA